MCPVEVCESVFVDVEVPVLLDEEIKEFPSNVSTLAFWLEFDWEPGCEDCA